mmetsp:Transcript_49678/g.124043  ORF Transcript_49678/g.124043 Transcript_49678/m.124043 type:complete len:210 (+) Transcript_49678:46-675(+)
MRLLTTALALACCCSTAQAFSSPPSARGVVSLRGEGASSAARHGRPLLGLKMQQKTGGEVKKAAEAGKGGEPNICDVNSELCDGQPHLIGELPKGTETVEKKEEKENMMTKVKAAGVAGLISYALWEFVFWAVSAPAAVIIYHQTTGEWPSFDNPESTAKVSAVIFGFLNFARALVPVRIGLTLASAPFVDKYICKPFNIGGGKKEEGA